MTAIKRYGFIFGLLCSLLLLTACATPYNLALNPKIPTTKSTIGHQQNLLVTAIDARTDKTIGGSIYGHRKPRKILTANLTPMLQKEMLALFDQQGFHAQSHFNTPPQRQILIKLIDLHYQDATPLMGLGYQENASASISVKASNQGRNYQETYSGFAVRRNLLGDPTLSTVDILVDGALLRAYNKMIADKALMRFLAN